MAVLIGLISITTSQGGMTIFGSPLGADYSAFYVAGTIGQSYSTQDLYHLPLQDHLYHSLLPKAPKDVFLPYAYPPFLTLLFQPFSLLPYLTSYLLWLLISFSLFLGGMSLIWKSTLAIPRENWIVMLLLALSFEPFVMENWLGGQVSSIGFFFLALALYCEFHHRPFWGGIALGFCLYKPTLLIFILPMLMFTKRFSMLRGFTVCAVSLVGVSWMFVGWDTLIDYISLLQVFTQVTTSEQTVFRVWKYIDLASFFRLLLGSSTFFEWYIGSIIPFVGLIFLWYAWKSFRQIEGRNQEQLHWAICITFTLVLNIYMGIYDSIFIVLACLLTLNSFYASLPLSIQSMPTPLKTIFILLYLTPWITQYLAQQIGVQIFTLVLFALGVYQFHLVYTFHSLSGDSPSPPVFKPISSYTDELKEKERCAL
jgi:hypothetical protein